MNPPPLNPQPNQTQQLVLGGRYRVLERLGSGGMADVFLAEQVSLGRKVALKVLRRTLADTADMTARFKREAMLLSTVDHPNVVRVLDFDAGSEGNVLVLEYVEGPRLDVAMEKQEFPVERSRRVLLQLAEGLAAIHARNIVHRDFKPENIVLSTGPNGEVARLLDFGVARLVAQDAESDHFVTRAGLGVGTPAYLAPEMVRGLPPTPATDVYAFGITAYRMLSGYLPFPGPTLDDFLKQHLDDPAPPLAPVAKEAAREDPALVQLVMRCLVKDPGKRPVDGQALVDALQRAPGQQATTKTASRFLPRLGWALAFAVSAVAALVLPTVGLQLWLPSARAKLLVDAGQPALALQLLDASKNEETGTPGRISVRLQALVALGATEEARRLLATACHRALIPAGPAFAKQVAAAGLVRGDAEGEKCLERARGR